MFKKTLKKTSISVDREQYDLFQKIANLNNSDASKEIRKFIEEYIRKNNQLAIKINMDL